MQSDLVKIPFRLHVLRAAPTLVRFYALTLGKETTDDSLMEINRVIDELNEFAHRPEDEEEEVDLKQKRQRRESDDELEDDDEDEEDLNLQEIEELI